MQLTSSPRRALGLVAVGALGLSTAVLGATGTASAAPLTGDPITFLTDVDADDEYEYDMEGVTSITIPAGYCSVNWGVYGGGGGGDGTGWGGDAGTIGVTTTVVAGQKYDLYAGTAGGDATQPVADDPDTTEVDEEVTGAGGAGGTNGRHNDGAAGTFDANDGFGGGGGAASEVFLDGVRQISAFGGDGAGTSGGEGSGGDTNYVLADVEPVWDEADASGDGSIDGQINPCAAPDEDEVIVTGAPIANWVHGVKNGLQFQLTISTVAKDNAVKGVQYSLDEGTWTDIATENAGDYQYSGTIPGLETGKSYQVSFRFTTALGHTAASKTLTGAPALPGPESVTAVSGAAQIKVSWTPPKNLTGVAGYRAVGGPKGAQSSAGSVSCQPTSALGTSCVLGATPGVVYTVLVESLDAKGERIGASDWVETQAVGAPPVPTTVPKADGTLISDAKDGKSTAGGQVTIKGTGFLPGSTVALVVYSTPVKLGEAVVLADGTFSATVTLPKDLANGTHHLVATGVDAAGNTRNLVVEVAVSGGTATAAVTAGPALAKTGFSALPWAGAGALALLAGGGLILGARRRNAA